GRHRYKPTLSYYFDFVNDSLRVLYGKNGTRRAVLPERVNADREKYYYAAEQSPFARSFAEYDEDPKRVQHRFDETDNAGVQRTNTAGQSVRKKDVSNADLKDAEIKYRTCIRE